MDDAYSLIGVVRKNSAEEVRVGLSEFLGAPLVDIRIFADFVGVPDERQPTRRGVALQVRALPDLIDLLKRAEIEARRRGLIGGGR